MDVAGHGEATPTPLFLVGSSVEVNIDETGFRDAYLSATVIPCSGKSSNEIYVQYSHLMADESGSDPLRLHVKVESLRPAPPSEENVRGFESYDVVDAFYQGGWCLGVLTRVVEAGKKFVVSFDDPAVELTFNLEHLRPHWDWADGKWRRRPSKSGNQIDVGSRVEVSFEGVECEDAWFQATVLESLENGGFVVEYTNSKGEIVMSNVDPLHIRPCPPLLRGKQNFNLLGKVEAFFDFGWWSGVIMKVLENNRYLVFFRQLKVDKEFEHSELRAQMEWNNGGWVLSPADVANESIRKSDEKSLPAATSANHVARRLYFSDHGAARKKQRVENTEGVIVLNSVRSMETSMGNEARVDQEESREELGGVVVEETSSGKEIVLEVEESPIVGEMMNVANEEGENVRSTEVHILPFEKIEALWQFVESTEPFQRFSQNPIFQPLAQQKIILQEGLTIGHMVNFSNLVKRASRLQVSDPKSEVEKIMATLSDLETHGFDVSGIRECLNELLVVKDKEEKLVDETKSLNDRIAVKCREKDV